MVRLDGAGDVLLTGPAVAAVAERADRVTFVSGPRGADAATMLPGIDTVEVLDAPWIPIEPDPFSPTVLQSRIDRWSADPFDAAIVFTSLHQSPLATALVLKLAGVPRVAGISGDHPGALLDVRLRSVHAVHEVDRGLELVAAAGYRPTAMRRLRLNDPEPPPLPVPDGAVVVHPGASVPARGLPAAATRGLIGRLTTRGIPVVLTGHADQTRPFASMPGTIDHGGRTDFVGLGAILSRARAVVVGNTGAAHLAAALDVPVVSVFAPTVPADRWCPAGRRVEVLGDQTIGCAGCRATTCPVPGQPCLDPVTDVALLAALERIWRSADELRRRVA